MRADINRVVLSGNVTRDAELRSTNTGMSVLTFGLAFNDSRRNTQTGEWEDIPNFVDCTMFGNRANGLSSYILKGTKVFIEGKLRYSSWEREGQKRSKLEVVVDSLVFGGGKAAQAQPVQQAAYRQPQAYQAPQAQPYAQPQYQQAPIQQPAPQAPVQQGMYDEDIPF